MIIKYTRESFDHKPDWKTECKELHWRQHRGGFSDYMYLWQTGHIMDIGDNELLDFVIVDVDNLPAGKREWLNTNRAAMAEALGVRSCHVLDSSSRQPDKCKVYLELVEPVSCDDAESYLTGFEIFSGVEVDKCTRSVYQLNYGIMLNSPEYEIDPFVFYGDVPAVRSTRGGSRDIFIPVNQQEKNRFMGKRPYSDPRLEWNYYRFIRKDGRIGRETITVRRGHRKKTMNLLVKIVTFNACMYNKYYNKTYTVDEVYDKVKVIMALQFEDAKRFIFENQRNVYQMCYNEWHRQMSKNIPELYSALCAELGRRENSSYMPREYSAAALYRSIRDKLTDLGEDEIVDEIGYIAEGDELVIKKILKYFRQENKNRISRKERTDRSKKHGYTQRSDTKRLAEIVSRLEKKGDIYLIPESIYSNSLRQFLYRKGLKYKKKSEK